MRASTRSGLVALVAVLGPPLLIAAGASRRGPGPVGVVGLDETQRRSSGSRAMAGGDASSPLALTGTWRSWKPNDGGATMGTPGAMS